MSPYSVYESDNLNRIKKIDNVALYYDGLGNMTQDDDGNTFSYNAKNLMTSAVFEGSTTTLSYDAMDRLLSVTKSGSTTKFLYDGTDLIAEYSSSGTLLRRYVHGPRQDEPLVWYEGSGTSSPRFLHADHQGSVIAVTSNSGAVLNQVSYDAYGNKNSSNTTYESRFSFTGQIWLKEIGLYYYKARMYNQKLGRFMQTDPIGYADGMNWYAYVGNDPVNSRDPFGLNDEDTSCKTGDYYNCTSLDSETKRWMEQCRNEGRSCSSSTTVGQGRSATQVYTAAFIIDWGNLSNPFGHAAFAATGRGVYSRGTVHPLGSSVTDYVSDRVKNRMGVNVYLYDGLSEEAIDNMLAAFKKSLMEEYSLLDANCVSACISAAQAGDLGVLFSVFSFVDSPQMLRNLSKLTADKTLFFNSSSGDIFTSPELNVLNP